MSNRVDSRRVYKLNDRPLKDGPVVYWMSRDQRISDNWALLHAQDLALKSKSPLVVLFCLVPKFLDATLQHYRFMIDGLSELEDELKVFNIRFNLLTGRPEEEIPNYCWENNVGALVTDFSPLRIKRGWDDALASKLDIAFFEVDTHNIVPYRIASPKLEYAAYTIRPKINKLLPEFLTDIPRVRKHPFTVDKEPAAANWAEGEKSLKAGGKTEKPGIFKAGETAAGKRLKYFLQEKLTFYEKDRNDPTKEGQSNLSPYLHFGQISAQRIALEVNKTGLPEDVTEPFLEELIVRKELSDNFCFYNKHYDTEDSFPRWAKESHDQHRSDKREYIYPLETFERAETHDDLWNAAQAEMMVKGKMHGYMRMYWAKKILEWTESPAAAMEIAVYLNDRYSLDGRDPNGYAGIAWSIGGVHDRAWFNRPVFGKVRYMNYNGSKSKFDVKKYIENNKLD